MKQNLKLICSTKDFQKGGLESKCKSIMEQSLKKDVNKRIEKAQRCRDPVEKNPRARVQSSSNKNLVHVSKAM